MDILLHRSGGIAGDIKTISVDTTQLDVATALQVEELVHTIGFFQLPTFVPTGAIGADLFRHDLTVIEGDRQHTVTFETFNGDAVSPDVEPLLRLVNVLRTIGVR